MRFFWVYSYFPYTIHTLANATTLPQFFPKKPRGFSALVSRSPRILRLCGSFLLFAVHLKKGQSVRLLYWASKKEIVFWHFQHYWDFLVLSPSKFWRHLVKIVKIRHLNSISSIFIKRMFFFFGKRNTIMDIYWIFRLCLHKCTHGSRYFQITKTVCK